MGGVHTRKCSQRTCLGGVCNVWLDIYAADVLNRDKSSIMVSGYNQREREVHEGADVMTE